MVEEYQIQELQEPREPAEDYEDLLDEQMSDYPQPKPSESLYALFNKVLKQKDNSKVGNLDKFELGNLSISVRDCQRISTLARVFKHEKFAEFFEKQGDITLQTSASKKGWFVELFVSQKKFTERTSNLPIPPQKKKWFKRNTPEVEAE